MPQLQNIYDEYKTPEDFARQLSGVYTMAANNKDSSLNDFYKGVIQDYEAAAEHYFPEQGVQGAKDAVQAAKDAASKKKLQDFYDQYKTPEDYARQLGNVYTMVANNKEPEFTDFYKDLIRDYEDKAEHYFPQQGVQGAKDAVQAAKDAAQAAQAKAKAEQIASEKRQLQSNAFQYGERATGLQAFLEGKAPKNLQREGYTQEVVDNRLQNVQASIRRLQDLGIPLEEIRPILETGTNEGSNDLIQYAAALNAQAAGLKGSGIGGVLRPLVSLLSVIPGPLQPFAAAINAADSINNGNTFQGLASLAGIPGISEAANSAGVGGALSAVKTANQANNLVKSVESGNILGALASGANLTGTGGVEIGDTGYNVADALKAANIAKAVDSGNYGSLIKALAPGAKADGPSGADFEEGYFAPGGEGYYDSALADSIAPTSDSLGDMPSNQDILDAIGYVPEEVSAGPATIPTQEEQQSSIDDLVKELASNEVPAEDVPEMVITAPRPEPDVEGLDITSDNIDAGGGWNPAGTPQDQMTPEDWAALYAQPTTNPVTGETIVGANPDDYPNQDFGVDVTVPDDFTGEGPALWQSNEDGTRTMVSDDGSTITIGADGNVVHYTEAPAGNLPGETPPAGATGGTGATGSTGATGGTAATGGGKTGGKGGTMPAGVLDIAPYLGLIGIAKGIVGGGSGGTGATGGTNVGGANDSAGAGNLKMDWNQQGVNSLVNGAAYGQRFFDPKFEEIPAAKGGLMSLAAGGPTGSSYNLGSYSDGGRLLRGPGDGMSDNIPATIAHKQPARLADGEFVIPADVVSHLGNGSTNAGSKVLYEMMNKVRRARTGNAKQGNKINPNKFVPR